MSKELLFLRNAEGGVDQDIWNDDVLIALYDKALQVAKKEVAQRIAMETNTKSSNDSKSPDQNIKGNGSPNLESKKNKKKNKSETWKEGQKCRAIFTEDGVEYEAVIKTILDEDTCIVKYVGYGNEEVQPLSGILPTKGKSEITKQIHKAAMEENWQNYSQTHGDEIMEPAFSESKTFKKKLSNSTQKGFKPQIPGGFSLPKIPSFPAGFEMDCGLPPPPPLPFLSQDNVCVSEDKTLYPMLVSWYMSGYYTGLYQGQKMRNQSESQN